MNQFKKAKQLRSETGQAIESITDLKTAGVIQKEKNTEPSITEEKKVQQNNTSTDILSNSRIIENNTLTTNVESTADNTNTDIDANIQTTVQSITETKPKESVLLSAQTPKLQQLTKTELSQQSHKVKLELQFMIQLKTGLPVP